VIADGDKIIQKIKKMKESIFVSQFEKVDDKNCRALTEVVLINIKKRGEKEIVVSLQSKKHLDPMFTTYLNLYDMGQRIKVEAINNSLKLISQGSTGRATELIEYLIGDSPIPDNSSNKLPKNIFKYLEGLNIQQQQAFLKAIDCSPVTLIKGPPGTGKTHVISSIIKYIVKELKEKVIVTSQTHVAIDNCLDQIVECRDCIIPYRITNIKNRYGTEEIDATLYDL
jgi:DNA replication protein DnaC